MVTKYGLREDYEWKNDFGLQFTDTAFSIILAANNVSTLTIPGQTSMGGDRASQVAYWLAIFQYSPTSKVYVANNATATLPPVPPFLPTFSELNPAARMVKVGDVLSFISSAGGSEVTVLLYSLS